MAPSSAFASAPASESAPHSSQTARYMPGCGTSVATPAGVRKMPEPTTDATISMVASLRERTRRRRSFGWLCDGRLTGYGAGRPAPPASLDFASLRASLATVLLQERDQQQRDHVGELEHRIDGGA